MKKFIDLTDHRYGRWTVLKFSDKKRNKRTAWVCLCDCGTRRVVTGNALRTGISKSCGCLQKEVVAKRNYRHGLRKSSEYRCWANMLNRCHDPKNNQYHNYGGRGIVVCKAWRSSFAAFIEDVGRRPSSKHTLDRKNNNKGYFPSNVRWATPKQQGNNKRNCRYVTCRGVTKTATQWSECLGIHYRTLLWRLNNQPVEKALGFA